MDPGETLLRFLDQAARDIAIPSEQRDGAAYIAARFRIDRNITRLIVQLDALLRGERVVGISPQIKPISQVTSVTYCNQTAVQRYGKYLQAAIAEFNVTPSIADFEGHPVKLTDNLEETIKAALDDGGKLKIHSAFVAAQQKANSYLARYTAKYGYHYIFRIGLGKYYMT